MTTEHDPTTDIDGETDTDADGAEAEETASVDPDEEDDERTGTLENTTPPAADDEPEEANGTETVPSVDLDLYDLSVRVSGQATDDLDTVRETAQSLMAYLVEEAQALEDSPDDRGLN